MRVCECASVCLFESSGGASREREEASCVSLRREAQHQANRPKL